MNSNSRIQKAILVNWKGMFYQSFDIDPGMTILEGANGTGKTTIMIAVYTCLIPDLNFLNFQNVTTVGTRRNEDKGLYGRIGQDEKNREEPIFSLLDVIASNGERHLIGVQLIKKTYPQVALKHFAIRNFPLTANIEPLLLRQDESANLQEILDLGEISESCRQQGAEFILFRHAKDYFQFLFEQDISPIRLVENEDRKKYNQLLHTSLYGGLSRTLQSSLRDYLLPENDKLVQGIHEMEQNLKTCRRTKSAIQRYQAVREVIRQVYDIGLLTYASAFFATRLDAEQKVRETLNVRVEKKGLKAQLNGLEESLESLSEEQKQLDRSLRHKNEELEQVKQALIRKQSAIKIQKEQQAKQAEFNRQQEIESTTKTRFELLKATEHSLQEEERKLGKQQVSLAKQLSDAGAAWQELSKRVGLYQQAEKLMAEASSLLKSDQFTVENIDAYLTAIKKQVEQAKTDHQKAHFQLEEATLQQEHFNHYLQLLQTISGEEISEQEAGKKAELLISRLSDLEKRLKESDEMPLRIGRTQEQIRNQERLLNALKGSDLEEIKSSADFDATRESLLQNLKTLKSRQTNLQEKIDLQNSELRAVKERLPVVKKEQGEWEQYQSIKKELENKIAVEMSNASDLANLQSNLEEQLQRLHLERYELQAKQKQTQKLYNILINEGSVQPGLKALAEQGYGSLLADRYEEIPADWSANLESRLGPLRNALVVKNIHKAANDLTGSFDRPDDLWLVEENQKEKLPEAIELSDSILVKHGDAWRLSRLPVQPMLGKQARALQIEALGDIIKQIASHLEKNERKIKGVQENQTLAGKLSLLKNVLFSTSPLAQMKELAQRKSILEKEIEEATTLKQRTVEQIERTENQEDLLRQFFPLKDLLDQPDLEKQLSVQQSAWEEMQEEEALNRDKLPLVNQLSQGLNLLHSPPGQNLEQLQSREKETRIFMEEQRKVLEVLERLDEVKEHFQYMEQVSLLEKKKSINQHLEKELESVEKQLDELNKKRATHESELNEASQLYYQEEAKLNTLKGQLDLLQESLEHGGATSNIEGLEETKKQIAAIEGEREEQVTRLEHIKEERYRQEAEQRQVSENLKKAKNRLNKTRTAANPLIRRWRLLHKKARQDRKYEDLQQEYLTQIQPSGKQAESFWRKVSAQRVTLISALEKIQDAKAVSARIRELTSAEQDDTDQAEISFQIWQQIQNYISQVIPVDLQTRDPEKAQEAIGVKLASLEKNLEEQEHSLRIHVQAIPSHLNAEIRKQKSRIRKLNEKLETIKFGFLQTIRIHIETHPKLKKFLDTLPQQLDIFAETSEESVSIESLMADLYEKEGAGKVRGDLLLDYRHYIRLSIEVKREGNQDFEKVTSTNLSTGESIGVGIAILIMVLMSWEEQTFLLKETEQRGGLRFLLLDESSRLDQKALHTLTEFCENLGLQLLIAAPAVERTLRGTTHHLTRGHFNGKEEVVVRGRRILAEVSN